MKCIILYNLYISIVIAKEQPFFKISSNTTTFGSFSMKSLVLVLSTPTWKEHLTGSATERARTESSSLK